MSREDAADPAAGGVARGGVAMCRPRAADGAASGAGARHMERDASWGEASRLLAEGVLKGKIGMAILVCLKFVFGRSQVLFGSFYHADRVCRFRRPSSMRVGAGRDAATVLGRWPVRAGAAGAGGWFWIRRSQNGAGKRRRVRIC